MERESKRPRQNAPYKIEVWHKAEGKNAPLSLASWKQMNTLLCANAATKVRNEGPPVGGIGIKNFVQHTHPGSEKASELPNEERKGHAVLRFSTLAAQEWYRPLITEVLGHDQDGNLMKLALEAESDDDRARYTASLPKYEYESIGNTDEERQDSLISIILAAIGVGKQEDCDISPPRILTAEGKEDLWSIALKLPPTVEVALDKILLNQRYGTLPTAICPVKVLKQKRTTTAEERIIEATRNMAMYPGRGKTARDSDGSTPKPIEKGPTMEQSY